MQTFPRSFWLWISLGLLTLLPALSSAQFVTGVSLNPSTVVGGFPTTGTVTLSKSVGVGGVNVRLSSSTPSAASVPASVAIASGDSTGTFAVSTSAYSETRTSSIQATLGTSMRSATLTLLGDGISGLALKSDAIIGGQSTTATVILLHPAPAWGWTVHFSNPNPNFLQVPSSITIPAGSSSGTVDVSTAAYGRTLSLSLTASDQTTSRNARLTSYGDAISKLALSPGTVFFGEGSTGTLTLDYPAPASGWTVDLTSEFPGLVNVPSSVVVPAGATSAIFAISSSTYKTQYSTLLTASDVNSTQSIRLAVEQASLSNAILEDQPLGYWRLNDASGAKTVHDFSGHGNNGVVSGNVAFGADGETGSTCAIFDGGNVQMSDPTGKAFKGTNAVSVEFWLKCPGIIVYSGQDSRGIYDVLDKGIDSSIGFCCSRLTASNSQFFIGPGAGGGGPTELITVNQTLGDGQWHQFVGQTDATAGTIELYIDGVRVTHGTFNPITWATTTQPLSIGGMYDYGYYQYFGSLSDVAVFSAPLSASEIQRHWMLGTVGS